MKKLLLTLFILTLFVNLYGQRIKNLPTQATYNAAYFVPVDYTTWGGHRKMTLQLINSGEKLERQGQDSVIWESLGLTGSAGVYDASNTAHYIDDVGFLTAGLDENFFNADWILDSVIYSIDTAIHLFEKGVGVLSVQQLDTAEANGNYSMAVNYATIADGAASFAMNKSVARENYSTAMGYESAALYRESRSIASNSNQTKKFGSAQMVEVMAMQYTTTATADTLWIGTGTTAALDTLHIPTDCVVRFEIDLVAVQYGGASGTVGDAWSRRIYGTIRNDAGTTALIGTVHIDSLDRSAGAAGWTVAVTANDVLDMLNIQVTGEANESIWWTAYIRMTMNGYRNFNLGY